MKKLSTLLLFTMLVLPFNSIFVSAQDSKQNKKEAHIKSLIDAQYYSFEAQTAIPLGMRTRQLTPGYELKVRKDSLEASLPYFGKAYTATIGTSDGGINFKTTDFTYTLTEGKKGGWNVTISPKNAGDTRQLNLSISSTGYCTLQVTSNNKQSISFYGYIQ